MIAMVQKPRIVVMIEVRKKKDQFGAENQIRGMRDAKFDRLRP